MFLCDIFTLLLHRQSFIGWVFCNFHKSNIDNKTTKHLLLPTKTKQDTFTHVDEVIYLNSVGCVILHPFLEVLFGSNNYCGAACTGCTVGPFTVGDGCNHVAVAAGADCFTPDELKFSCSVHQRKNNRLC